MPPIELTFRHIWMPYCDGQNAQSTRVFWYPSRRRNIRVSYMPASGVARLSRWQVRRRPFWLPLEQWDWGILTPLEARARARAALGPYEATEMPDGLDEAEEAL